MDAEFWDWIRRGDAHLDDEVSELYKEQPLAQDWARIAKVIEELGETIGELILYTGQNPRKQSERSDLTAVLCELADVVCTGILGIQHFTKADALTKTIIEVRMRRIFERISQTHETPS